MQKAGREPGFAAAISGVIRQLESEGGGSRRNQPQSIFQERKTQT